MRARCPGSTSNLGPGFDALGLALGLYVEVEVAESDELTIVSAGSGAELPRTKDHLAARVARAVRGNDNVAIMVNSEIPLRRGLGSSAALAAAVAAACGAPDPLAVAASFDGHAENAAASVRGGLVAATFVDGAPVAAPLPLDPGIAFVLVVPDRELETAAARAVLPATVPFADAVANLGRMALLLAGLANRDVLAEIGNVAGEDRLHQPARGALYPEADGLMSRLREAGASVSCWSGAGPSLLGICTEKEIAADVRAAGESALVEFGMSGEARILEADTEGLRLS